MSIEIQEADLEAISTMAASTLLTVVVLHEEVVIPEQALERALQAVHNAYAVISAQALP